MTFFDFKTTTLDGAPADLSRYRGQVLLVVNTASECGYTPQYEGLEQLSKELKGQGLQVLGFPSNDFGGQEPGTPEQISQFCEVRYHIDFPMFGKLTTKGEGQSPLYAFLSKEHGESKWNFHKYLVGRDGQVKQAFKSRVEPNSPELREAITAALRETTPG